MPFTFAHPLYAAPLKAIKPKYISLTGIILGSMSPDFEYFIALEPYQSIGHTTLGLLLQAIPLSILFAVLFHYLVKDALAANLPSYFALDARLQNARKLSLWEWKLDTLQKWIVFLVSIVIGFYSHVLVDSFTHSSGYFVARIYLLQDNFLGIRIYKWLQHGLSMLGLIVQAAIIIYWLGRLRPERDGAYVRTSGKLLYWLIVAASAAVTVSAKIVLSSSGNMLGSLIVSSISGMLIGIVIASFAYHLIIKEKE